MQGYTITYTTRRGTQGATMVVHADSAAEAALRWLLTYGRAPESESSAVVVVDGADVLALRDDNDGTWWVPGGDFGHAARAAAGVVS